MNSSATNNSAILAGRVLLAIIFILSGFSKISGYAGTAGYLEKMGIPGMLLPGIDIAKTHSDWVVKVDDNDNLGFTVQTLKREFRDLSEDVPTGAGTGAAAFVGSTIVNPVAVIIAAARSDNPIEVNRMHFLAGRRSWRLDDGKNFEVDGDVLVLETTAVERFSHKMYMQADPVLGMEDALPDVWIAMLNNFLRMNALVRVPQRRRPGWQNRYDIDYYVNSFDSFESLASDAEFAQQRRLGLFKTLLPAQ